MMLLAIDPGPEQSAFVVWDGAGIYAKGKESNETVLYTAHDFGINPYNLCVIEMIEGRGMPVGNPVFETCVWIGRFMEAFGPSRVDRILRREVKLHLCGSSRAKDANVRQEVINRLGAPGTKKSPGVTYGLKEDTWQALALALVWCDQHTDAFAPKAVRA